MEFRGCPSVIYLTWPWGFAVGIGRKPQPMPNHLGRGKGWQIAARTGKSNDGFLDVNYMIDGLRGPELHCRYVQKRGGMMYSYQGCARLMNQRQHDLSYQPLAMDSPPQLPSGTNYTTSTIVPRSNRTRYRHNRTTAYQRHSRSWQAASRAPSSPLWRCQISVNWTRGVQTLCVTKFASPLTLSRQPHSSRISCGGLAGWTGVIWISGNTTHESSTTLTRTIRKAGNGCTRFIAIFVTASFYHFFSLFLVVIRISTMFFVEVREEINYFHIPSICF